MHGSQTKNVLGNKTNLVAQAFRAQYFNSKQKIASLLQRLISFSDLKLSKRKRAIHLLLRALLYFYISILLVLNFFNLPI